nr:MAG TPA: hypothetical protein [Caudoviricetes sp.]
MRTWCYGYGKLVGGSDRVKGGRGDYSPRRM